MGKNTGDGFRQGAVNKRSQTYNPKTEQFVKRGENGQFIGAKDTPYKGVKKEKGQSIGAKDIPCEEVRKEKGQSIGAKGTPYKGVKKEATDK